MISKKGGNIPVDVIQRYQESRLEWHTEYARDVYRAITSDMIKKALITAGLNKGETRYGNGDLYVGHTVTFLIGTTPTVNDVAFLYRVCYIEGGMSVREVNDVMTTLDFVPVVIDF